MKKKLFGGAIVMALAISTGVVVYANADQGEETQYQDKISQSGESTI